MAIWQGTFYIDILNKAITTTEIFPILDSFLKRDWGVEGGGQCWGNPDTNDVWVSWDKETEVIDEDIRIRVDLRNIDIEFIQRIIKIAKERELKFKIINEETFDPDLAEIARILAESNAEKFVTDPRKFLDDFEKGIIKPE